MVEAPVKSPSSPFIDGFINSLANLGGVDDVDDVDIDDDGVVVLLGNELPWCCCSIARGRRHRPLFLSG